MRASNDREIEAAFESAIQQRIRIVAVTSDPFFNTRSDKLVALATRHAVPTVYPFREYAAAGGLMSYGVDPARCIAKSESMPGKSSKASNRRI